MSIKTKKGFTLIEVVIVLAIAALILVIVFIAVAGAQRGQRNEARRKIAGLYSSAVDNVKGNGVATTSITTTQLNNNIQDGDRVVNGVRYGAVLTAAGSMPTSGDTCAVNTATDAGILVEVNSGQTAVCTETAQTGATNGQWYRTND